MVRTSSRLVALSSAIRIVFSVADATRRQYLRIRQYETEPAAFTRFAFHPNAAPMQLDEPLRNGQAQAGALANAFGGRANLVELLEDRFVLLGGNADAGIVDRDGQAVSGR